MGRRKITLHPDLPEKQHFGGWIPFVGYWERMVQVLINV
jgi:hypothetical protein